MSSLHPETVEGVWRLIDLAWVTGLIQGGIGVLAVRAAIAYLGGRRG